MPEPIKGNLNFEARHNIYNADYSMKAMMACRDYYEIGFIISGRRKIIMPDHIHYLQKGIVATTPMNVYLRSSPGSDQLYERILIKYKPVMVEEFISLIGQQAFDDLNYRYIHHFTEPVREQILQLMLQMVDVYENYNRFSELIFKGMLHQLLTIVYTERQDHKPEDTFFFNNTNPIIVEALYYMENTFMSAPTLAEVATYLNVSREHLSRIFKQSVGITFSEYLNKIRLRHVVDYLENTDFSMEKIAELSGFSNSNYMCDVFKHYHQVSPSTYRKNNQGMSS